MSESERRAAFSIRIPPWAVGVVIAVVAVVGAVIGVDSRYVKAPEFERHVQSTATTFVTKEVFEERARLRDEQLRSGSVEANAKLQALTEQVSRLADLMQSHQQLTMHPGTSDAFRGLEQRFASVEANQRWSIEALQAILRRQGIATPVAPPPSSPGK